MKSLDKIHQLLSGSETIPIDYKTSNQWAETMGLSGSYTRDLIRKLILKGRCDVKHFKVKNSIGHYAPTPHYRIKL